MERCTRLCSRMEGSTTRKSDRGRLLITSPELFWRSSPAWEARCKVLWRLYESKWKILPPTCGSATRFRSLALKQVSDFLYKCCWTFTPRDHLIRTGMRRHPDVVIGHQRH